MIIDILSSIPVRFYIIFAALAAAVVIYWAWTKFFIVRDKEQDLYDEVMSALAADAAEEARKTEKKSPARRLMVLASRIGSHVPVSEANATKARMRLARAGVDMTPAAYYGITIITAVIGAAAALVIASLLDAAPTARIAVFCTVLAIALLLPFAYLRQARANRVSELDRKLPDDIDLLVVTARAGRSLTTGLESLAKYCDDAFSREIDTATREIASGITRAEALKGVRDRCDTDACDAFLSALIQAEQRGGETADFLARQAEVCRERYRLGIEAKVNKVGTKITLVLCLVIFPTMLIITLSPTVLQLFEAMSTYATIS